MQRLSIEIDFSDKWSNSHLFEKEGLLENLWESSNSLSKYISKTFKIKDNPELNKEERRKNLLRQIGQYNPAFSYKEVTHSTCLGIICKLMGEVRPLKRIKEAQKLSNCGSLTYTELEQSLTFETNIYKFSNERVSLQRDPVQVASGAGGVVSSEGETWFKKSNRIACFLNAILKLEEPDFNNLVSSFKLGSSSNKEELISSLLLDFSSTGTLVQSAEELRELIENYVAEKNKEPLELDKKGEPKKTSYNPRILFIYEVLSDSDLSKVFTQEDFSILSKNGNIKGLASTSGLMTIKDFYTNFVSAKKTDSSFPLAMRLPKFEGSSCRSEINWGLTKESGTLFIRVELPSAAMDALVNRIEQSKVRNIYVGKKGLAFIKSMTLLDIED